MSFEENLINDDQERFEIFVNESPGLALQDEISNNEISLQSFSSNFQPVSLQQFGTVNSINSVLTTTDQPYQQPKFEWKQYHWWIAIFIWYFLSSIIFSKLQSWSLIDSFYYTFVTMTGIGFGDLVVSYPWAIEFSYYFLFTTIAFFAFCIGLATRHFRKRFLKTHEKQRLRREKRRRKKRERDRIIRERDIEISVPTQPRIIPRVPSTPNGLNLKDGVFVLGSTSGGLVPNCNGDTWPRATPSPLQYETILPKPPKKSSYFVNVDNTDDAENIKLEYDKSNSSSDGLNTKFFTNPHSEDEIE